MSKILKSQTCETKVSSSSDHFKEPNFNFNTFT